MTHTRAEIRLALGYELDDVLPITVTAHADNSTTKLYAVGQINAGAESNAGREIICRTADTNLGVIRRVIATNPREGWLQLDRAVNEAFATNDTAELYGFRGRGWRIDHYHNVINVAIVDDSHPAHKGTPVTAAVTLPFDADDTTIAVPASINWLSALEYLPTGATLYRTVPMAEDRMMQGWSVDLPNAKLIIRGDHLLTMMDGATLRCVGFTRPTALTAETSTTTVPLRFIVDRCMERMLGSAEARGPGNYNRGMLSRDNQLRSKLAIRTRGLGARAKLVRE